MKIRALKALVKNEEGSALIYALIILVLMTIIGITSLNTTMGEFKTTSDYRRHNQNIYSADSAVMAGAQFVESQVSKAALLAIKNANINLPAQFNSTPSKIETKSKVSYITKASGSSGKVGNVSIYTYGIRGEYSKTKCNGSEFVGIDAGYRKVF